MRRDTLTRYRVGLTIPPTHDTNGEDALLAVRACTLTFTVHGQKKKDLEKKFSITVPSHNSAQKRKIPEQARKLPQNCANASFLFSPRVHFSLFPLGKTLFP